MPKIVVVVPCNRPERMASFREAWNPLFTKHDVQLFIVWDGDRPQVEECGVGVHIPETLLRPEQRDLICRYTDSVRNLGFIAAAKHKPDYILTLDDDVTPPPSSDPIQEHLDVLHRRVPTHWMNTAMGTSPYLRGVPYNIREHRPVMVSHGVWINIPDLDGETQLRISNNGKNPERIPYTLPYYVGPVPHGTFFPICGMNLMFHRDMMPYVYFAPMGSDCGFPDLHRFGDIWMGVFLKQTMDTLGSAIYTGNSVVIHTRASDPFKNYEIEKLGRDWNEHVTMTTIYDNPIRASYFKAYENKRQRYKELIQSTMG